MANPARNALSVGRTAELARPFENSSPKTLISFRAEANNGRTTTIATPEITQTAAQSAAVVHLTIPRVEMMKVFGPAVGELMAALAAQKVEPVGTIFAHHLKMSPDVFDFELGVRVATPVGATGRVKPGELPSAKVARTTYTGSYAGLSNAWREFDSWLKANGHEPAVDLWEVYSVGPQSSPDPSGWRTELNRPLKNWRQASEETRTFRRPLGASQLQPSAASLLSLPWGDRRGGRT